MKLAFSTIGCPDFDWPDIYSMAKDFGFRGIEIRGLGEEIFAVRRQSCCKSCGWKSPACPPAARCGLPTASRKQLGRSGSILIWPPGWEPRISACSAT